MRKGGASSDPRVVAIAVLKDVLEGGISLTAALASLPESELTDPQRSLASALSYGVLRWYVRLDCLLLRLLPRPLRKKESDIRLLLLIGLYQLSEQRVPEYASVSEAVETVVRLKKVWAKSLVNGVLRNFIRQRESLLLSVDENEWVRYAFPAWLGARLQQDWGERSGAIMQACNEQAPMILRLNQQKTMLKDYLDLLSAKDIAAHIVSDSTVAIQLCKPCEVEKLPGFAQGVVSVQDAAAQLAAGLLDAQVGDRVLDGCAAPGGKTGHILELQPEIAQMVCVDVDAQRLMRVEENLQRIMPDWQNKVVLSVANLLELDAWWDGELFDRILLDAPCSATGVIRRHPDIKYLRKHSDINVLREIQRSMLHCLWGLLKPGGRLLYATCSVLQCENELQIESFVNQCGGAIQVIQMVVPYTQARPVGYQIFPGEYGTDGFYYAALQKPDLPPLQ